MRQRLKKRAYAAIALAERARIAEKERNMPQRRKDAPLKMKLELPQAEAQEQQALEHLEAWEWLFHEMRQALEPIDPQGHIASSRQVGQTIETALELLTTLHNQTIQAFTTQLAEKLDELLAPLAWLESALTCKFIAGCPTGCCLFYSSFGTIMSFSAANGRAKARCNRPALRMSLIESRRSFSTMWSNIPKLLVPI